MHNIDASLKPSAPLSTQFLESPGCLIDQERYPILERTSARAVALKTQLERQQKELGICLLPGFLAKDALERACEESHKLLPLTYHSDVVGNAYLTPEDPQFAKTHPRNLTEETSLGVIAYDQIPSHHAIRMLYEWEPFMDFIAHCILGKPKIFRYADPLGALNLSVMKDNDYLRWHFDQTDFVVSLALQNSISGGDFEYVPFIRTPAEENYAEVEQTLLGENNAIKRAPIEPGTLIFFEGRHSLHRVARIHGDRPRIMALLGYDTKEAVMSSEHLRLMRYGRS